MAEETLLTAARRVVRFFNIDNTIGGGLISIETSQAVEALDKQVQLEQQEKRMTRSDLSADFALLAKIVAMARAEHHRYLRHIRVLRWLLFLSTVGLGLALWAILLWRL